MQRQNNGRRYIFEGNAVGVSAQFVHPFHEVIPVQAASVLPSDGGFGSARVEGFRHREVLSFAAAYTEVVGTEAHEGVSETMVVSVVEKFNLLDLVTCDRIVARLTSKHPGYRGEGNNLPVETSVVPIGSRFEGLRIGTMFFERLEVAPDYFCQPEHASWTGLVRALDNENDRSILGSLALPGADGKSASLQQGARGGLMGFCLALGQPNPDAQFGAPLRFHVPQFGTVHLGEYFCCPTSRSLTMLRVDLGCPVQGQLSASTGRGGGTSYPP